MEILRSDDPFFIFQNWLKDAEKSEINDPNAMALATVGADGCPSVRMVLLKDITDKGFQFFTNMESNKAKDIQENQNVAFCLHWKSLLRQIRVEGSVTELSRDLVTDYFTSRHPLSRRGAWASLQSRPLDSRETLLERVAGVEKQYPDDDNIPCPLHWGGYLITPRKIEFWQQGDGRLHDRFLFTRENEMDAWDLTRLYP